MQRAQSEIPEMGGRGWGNLKCRLAVKYRDDKLSSIDIWVFSY